MLRLHKFYLILVVLFTLAPACRAPDPAETSAVQEVITLNDAEHPEPFFYTPGVKGLYGDSHGGYGYIGTSEAQSDSLFRFSCDSSSLPFHWASGTTYADLSVHLIHARVLQILRDQVFEYWALRYAGTLKVTPENAPENANEAFDLKPPHCISTRSSGTQALQEIAKLPAPKTLGPKNPLSDTEIRNLTDGTSQRLMMKYRGTYNQLQTSTLAYALGFSDLLESQKKSFCRDKNQEAACFDVQGMQRRLQGDFESLFNLSNAHVNYIRKHLIQLIGASATARELGWRPDRPLGTAFTLPESETYRRGKQIYDSWTEGGTSQSILRLQAGIAEAIKDGRFAVEKHRAGEKVPLSLKDELLLLRENAMNHWALYHAEIPLKVQAICDLSYNELIEKYPNAVRQALVDHDSDPVLKQEMRASLCAQESFKGGHGAQQGIQPVQSCAGVRGEKLPSAKQVVISRSVPLFPFNTETTYTIAQKEKQEPYQIDLKVEFEFDADFSEKERSDVLNRWQTHTQTWYNCQSHGLMADERGKLQQGKWVYPSHYFQEDEPKTHSQVSCQTDPELLQEVPKGIRFHFHFIDSAIQSSSEVKNQAYTSARLDPQKVYVHHCYRAELSAPDNTDCVKIRQWIVGGCQKKCETGGESAKSCLRSCEADTPHAGSARNNRANASHWIATQRLTTVFHEIGHLLGLYDDYIDFALPLNLIAEPDNIMCKQNHPNVRLHPRNFFTMLEPLRCTNLESRASEKSHDSLSPQKKKARRRSHAGPSRK